MNTIIYAFFKEKRDNSVRSKITMNLKKVGRSVVDHWYGIIETTQIIHDFEII
jgi:hypothetical protein